MLIAIIGGKLQGTEACYLAMKAGFKTLLIDRNREVPAHGLCDEFYCCDIRKKEKALIGRLQKVDFILPAMENDAVLQAVREINEEYSIPVAFDFAAYDTTVSKIRSDQLMRQHQIPAPAYYPDCSGACIAKPSTGSGSDDVIKLQSDDAAKFLASKDDPETWIIQEYLEGPSYSIEVIGTPGSYATYQVTKIHMDEGYDCSRVTAPCPITSVQVESFKNTAVILAEMVGLRGIMDVEVIDDNGFFKVLEIDARIPSQTPTAVLHTSGINLLSEIAHMMSGNHLTDKPIKNPLQYCSYEHFLIDGKKIIAAGEHIMAEASSLQYREDFLCSDEVISDYRPDTATWRGTFINWADSLEDLEAKRKAMKAAIANSIR